MVGSDIILQDDDIDFKSINKDNDGKITDVDVDTSVELKSEDTTVTKKFDVVFYEIDLTTGKAKLLHTENVAMTPGTETISYNWKVSGGKLKFKAIAVDIDGTIIHKRQKIAGGIIHFKGLDGVGK